MTSAGGLPGEHSSPSKRKAVEEVVDVETGDRLSLESFLRAELNGHQEAMKGDIHDAMGGVKKEMAERIEVAESEVTKQLQTTLLLLKQLTDKHDIQQEAVSKLTAGQKALEEKLEGSLEERIEKLEAGGGGRGPSAHSTATTEGDGIGGRRAPALVVGGWNDNTPANEVIEKATQVLRQLQIDIDYQDMFVPGIRRGFMDRAREKVGRGTVRESRRQSHKSGTPSYKRGMSAKTRGNLALCTSPSPSRQSVGCEPSWPPRSSAAFWSWGDDMNTWRWSSPRGRCGTEAPASHRRSARQQKERTKWDQGGSTSGSWPRNSASPPTM